MLTCCHGLEWDIAGVRFVVEGGQSVVFSHITRKCCCVLKMTKVNHGLTNSYIMSNSPLNDIQINYELHRTTWGVLSFCIPHTCHTKELSPQIYNALDNTWRKNRLLNRIKNDDSESYLSTSAVFEENVFRNEISARNVTPCNELVLEIKVKSAVNSISPFIYKESTYLKHRMSRFEIMQLHKQNKLSNLTDESAPWGIFSSISNYCPADFCSGDIGRIRRAMHALVCSPQNNLKVVVNDTHVYGWEKANSVELLDALSDCLVFDTAVPDSLLVHFINICSVELSSKYNEQIQQLVSLQCLDILDSEGAKFVYLHICESVYADDQKQFDIAFLTYLVSPHTESLNCISHLLYQYHRGISCDRLLQQLSSETRLSLPVKKVIELALTHVTQPILDKQANCLRVQSIVREELTMEDCMLLLKAWMLSTIASDASLVLHLSLAPDGGIITSKLSLIDVGIKSFTKLTKKAAKDELVCELVSTLLPDPL